MTATTAAKPDLSPLFEMMLNMTAFHHDHEKFYSVSPREQAVVLQRQSRTVHALADRWALTTPEAAHALSPYAGAADLNAPVALQLEGVLFMEGEGEPGEIRHLKRDIRLAGSDAVDGGEWLATAMQSSWDMGTTLFSIDRLADLLGERHRIIANNWQGAAMMVLAGRVLLRAADLLDQVDLAPAAVRADLTAGRVIVGRLYSAAEMIDHAADLFSEFAGVVHDNERRWRVFRARVAEVAASSTD